MKIRTIEQLQEKIDHDFAWRRKELTFFENSIKIAGDTNLSMRIRSGIVMLYAHWEGFIKNAAENYLAFVASKRLNYDELHHCFVALAFKKHLSLCEESNKASVHKQAVDFLLGDLSHRAAIPCENVINTQSNLRSFILKDILITIGLDFASFEQNAELIDSKLVDNRNTIAHGQHLNINRNDVLLLFRKIPEMIDQIKNEILNAAVLESYRKRKAA